MGHGGIHLLVSHHRWWWWSIGWLCSSCKYIVNQHYNIIIIIDNALWNADRRSNRSPHSFPCDIILMSPHWHSQQKRKKTEPSSSSRRRRRPEEQSSQAHGGSQFTVIWRDQFVDPRSLAAVSDAAADCRLHWTGLDCWGTIDMFYRRHRSLINVTPHTAAARGQEQSNSCSPQERTTHPVIAGSCVFRYFPLARSSILRSQVSPPPPTIYLCSIKYYGDCTVDE